MAIKILQEKKLTWINIDSVNAEALEYLKKNYKFHHLDLEDIQSESQTPKIDVYKDYLFIVLQFPHWQTKNNGVVAHEVDIFIGEGYVITVQHSKTKELKNFFYRCMRNRNVKKEWMSGSSGFLLYKIIDSLFHNSRPILNNIGKQVSRLDDAIFNDIPDNNIVRKLAIHRRNILHFRRTIDPQRYLMSNLSHTRKPFLGEDMTLYFDDLNDYLSKLWTIVSTYKDTIDGLHVTVESLINQRTNKVISALTVISVSLLPLTLLAGIYGMNIRLPLAKQPEMIWLMFGALAAGTIIFILILKKKRWL
ncbi:MAG: magnesium transporter CorA family protein [Candidatus Magasanikbacteria bacterium]|jgi:magnesium transporter|nr:magnesium transporter CorA family protein [Candidatus Magasanikbacteria bacterium]MBT4221086.1 magnesium transporter CorA family protein [Candidatus Magasanikbacteria bacterium]MBT4350570.1 magnesium transporter CorA family protein [Candidatus Magasanikbacteria bacterium]MBT4542131.1 magnesium transporter CorA family protein [Candidatus Magasanikbacteria bacterium]MBT6253253.1 magnesium transporter CorA family protein [Candidatus Magasanikbacteria bacterium]